MPAYRSRHEAAAAFGLVGFTKFVESGGDLYEEVRHDGRWDLLRGLGGGCAAIYGVASEDSECPPGRYRYTVAVRTEDAARSAEGLFAMRIPAAEWVIFTLDSFADQYGGFWQANPYALVRELGWEFDPAVGLHVDVFGPSFAADTDSMEFMMPVRRPG